MTSAERRPGRPPKLTREQAMAIRDEYLKGVGMASLAVRHAIGKTAIREVINGRYPTVRDQPDIARARFRSTPGKYSIGGKWS